MSIASDKPKIIVIVGPTASGKTRLSLDSAEHFKGEIVSADSRQIYRGMDIGTAKPTVTEQADIPHYLINIKDPNEEYTVAEYQRDAIAAIQNILERGMLPILIGGTGLYVKAVLDNLDIPQIKADPILRAEIEADIKNQGLEKVFERLVVLDPEAEYVVDPKNPRRVVRALEVAITTGEPFTAQRKKRDPLFHALVLGLDPGVEMMRERIDARVDMMIKDGLVLEVKNLLKRYGPTCQAFDAIGYREIISYLNNEMSLDDAIALMKRNTFQYARRQMTWFRKDKSVQWLASAGEAEEKIKTFLNNS